MWWGGVDVVVRVGGNGGAFQMMVIEDKNKMVRVRYKVSGRRKKECDTLLHGIYVTRIHYDIHVN